MATCRSDAVEQEHRLRLLHRHSELVEECGASKRLILRQAQDGRGRWSAQDGRGRWSAQDGRGRWSAQDGRGCSSTVNERSSCVLEKSRLEHESRGVRRLAIIADDLTGANDAGSLFARAGSRVCVAIGGTDAFDRARQADVPVLDTESRLDSPEAASNKVLKAARMLRAWGANVVLKKIDTALRGPVGAEIDAAMDGLGQRVCFVIPAIPEMERVTVGGRQMIQGVPLEETCFADDPFTPAVESDVPALLGRQTDRQVAHIGLAAVVERRIEEEIERLIRARAEIVVVDAARQDDIVAAVEAIAGLGLAGLLVGSLGLAEALTDVFPVARKPCEPRELRESRDGGVLGVIGSFHEITLRQVSAAMESGRVEVVRLNPTSFLASPSSETERAVRGVRSALEGSKSVLLVTASTKDDVVGCVDQGKCKGMDPLETRAAVSEALGKTAARIVGGMPVRGLFLCGGDTAWSVCRALGAEALLIEKTIETGVVSSTVVGGPHEGLTVVTKGGSVGGADTILRALGYLGGNG